ncbi:MAG: hypothetical protein JW776_05160 [Candidatus Lokiarchaeota archaeon]|nr:hypothetical protein [Candidatus Lokiarchaeota archaeon]
MQNLEIIPEGLQVSERIISIPGLSGYKINCVVFGPVLVFFAISDLVSVVIRPNTILFSFLSSFIEFIDE